LQITPRAAQTQCAILENCQLPSGWGFVMQAQHPGRSLPQFFLAFILASCSTSVAFGKINSPPHENAAPANFEALAKSATEDRVAR
jgi:hypothetical protein